MTPQTGVADGMSNSPISRYIVRLKGKDLVRLKRFRSSTDPGRTSLGFHPVAPSNREGSTSLPPTKRRKT